jgi:hypothetical protein
MENSNGAGSNSEDTYRGHDDFELERKEEQEKKICGQWV